MKTLDVKLASDATDHERAIAQRAEAIRALIEVGAADARLPEFKADPGSEVAVFNWGNRAMVTAPDPDGMDTIQTVGAMMDALDRDGRAVGDCMHRATLIGAALAKSGRGCFLIFQSFHRGGDGKPVYGHVLAAEASIIDATRPGVRYDPQECNGAGESLAADAELVFQVARPRAGEEW